MGNLSRPMCSSVVLYENIAVPKTSRPKTSHPKTSHPKTSRVQFRRNYLMTLEFTMSAEELYKNHRILWKHSNYGLER